ncbi:MAG: SAM-dependent methyltransferase [Coleofasciculaceae cyanobacterium SM2_1_6]|nr:SAM-dependent methyltransferase [Coleofasciculaceae cyanobacterium SM2_1_6]
MNKNQVRRYLQEFKFRALFVQELFWNNPQSRPISLTLDAENYKLKPLAEKAGFVIYECEPDRAGNIPIDGMRRWIDRQIAKFSAEHIIIYTNQAKTAQRWQWVRRELGKPLATREEFLQKGQSGERLIQKLEALVITDQDQENSTISAMTDRARKAFNVDTVIKSFYDGFKKEHQAFLGSISNIESEFDRAWYASVILNRLMFIYFLQRKGFLAGDRDYLAKRLELCQQRFGNDEFYSFYRYFLLRLFHEGLGQNHENNPALEALLGKVPYLNGGLFQKHQLEENYLDIQIPDRAFEKVFEFLGKWDWHLDDRPLKQGNEINPDVLGYIFEKYINQKQMGAYYTKEDITEYISKNAIIPFLFDRAQEQCEFAFRDDALVWQLLAENCDRYIYPAVLKGVDRDLPPEIAAGIEQVAARSGWNRPAAEAFALPTETWREHVARRQRCQLLRAKMRAGELRSINDLITYNLDIRQFAQDVIQSAEGAELVRAFYGAIREVSILDPTCGSGAFLFAAVNVLAPLYEACLDRMAAFVDSRQDSPHPLTPSPTRGEGGQESISPLYRSGRGDALSLPKWAGGEGLVPFSRTIKKFPDFEQDLQEMGRRSNRKYFILKSIILQNLYGVDIMEEATEICKLRLFLKLVAQVDAEPDQPNYGLEPLPDIDFNIRSGNTLVGFANYEEVRKSIEGDGQKSLDLFSDMGKIEEKAKEVDRGFQLFQSMQTNLDLNPEVFRAAKTDLRGKLATLGEELNQYLAREYGIDPKKKTDYQNWRTSHKPFHWFVEFYGLINKGGFDVIIGNPPYLEQKEVNYLLKDFRCRDSKAVHAMCIERGLQILLPKGTMSMILPLSIVSTQRMKIVQELLENQRNTWYANYSWRPAKLFDTVNRALTIFTVTPSKTEKIFTTNYQKWISSSRDGLMERVNYIQIKQHRSAFWMPKVGDEIESLLLSKCISIKSVLSDFIVRSENRIYYRTTGGLYWKVFTDFAPTFSVDGKSGHSTRENCFTVQENEIVKPIIAILSSNLFWWWYTVTSNCRDVNPYDIYNFPIPNSALLDKELLFIGSRYITDLKNNSTMLERKQKQTGITKTQSFKIQKSKPIIDEIDRILAQHYGFTEEELDFIINYDIKYRMGKDTGSEE